MSVPTKIIVYSKPINGSLEDSSTTEYKTSVH